jgi:hypothetical protein
MVEPDPQQPPSGHVLDTGMSAAGTQVSVQVGDRFGHAGVVGGQHRLAGGLVAEAVEDRDAFGRAQDHVERRDGVAAMRAPQQLTRLRIPALEHGPEPGHRCFALQPQTAGAGAVPPAWTLAVAGQIRLVVGGQLPGVVGLPAHRELGDVGHHPATPLPAIVGASKRTRGALLSSENGLG